MTDLNVQRVISNQNKKQNLKKRGDEDGELLCEKNIDG